MINILEKINSDIQNKKEKYLKEIEKCEKQNENNFNNNFNKIADIYKTVHKISPDYEVYNDFRLIFDNKECFF